MAARWAPAVAVAVVLGLTLALVLGESARLEGVSSLGTRSSVPRFHLQDETGSLGPTYHPGVILGVAGNGSAALLGGIGVYLRNTDFTLPAVASMVPGPNGPVTENLTPSLDPYFWEGGIYGAEWNGSGWLVVGQAGWGGGNFGTMVTIEGGKIVNQTGLISAAFSGGGVFAIGWNGTSWLLGGNSSQGLALVGVSGASVHAYSSALVGTVANGWIQTLQWNGAEWLIGGQGMLATMRAGHFTNLWPDAPRGMTGVYASAWNGSIWLAGGGAGDLVGVLDDTLHSATSLPTLFDQAVLFIAPLETGWLVGGKGTALGGGIAPELVYWASATPGGTVQDLSPDIPSSFDGGEIQAGAPAPMFGPSSYLLVGEGTYDVSTGYGLGAVAWLSVS